MDLTDLTDADLDAMDALLKQPKKMSEPLNKPLKPKADPVAKKHFYKTKSTRDRLHRNVGRYGALQMRTAAAKEENLELVMHLEYQAWKLRVMGTPVYKIAEELKTTPTQVFIWLNDAVKECHSKTAQLIELDREIELARTETLLERYMPLALVDDVTIKRIQRGEAVEVKEIEQPQRCAYIVMELIKMRARIKGLDMPSSSNLVVAPAIDVSNWLRTQHEFIRDAAKAAPADVLTLEIDEAIDANEQSEPPPATVPDAV
jgi:hypothetical protein